MNIWNFLMTSGEGPERVFFLMGWVHYIIEYDGFNMKCNRYTWFTSSLHHLCSLIMSSLCTVLMFLLHLCASPKRISVRFILADTLISHFLSLGYNSGVVHKVSIIDREYTLINLSCGAHAVDGFVKKTAMILKVHKQSPLVISFHCYARCSL